MYNFFSLFFKIYTFLISRRFYRFGKNSIIKPFLNTNNTKYISIGDNVNIGSFSWVSVSTEYGGWKTESKRKIRLKIGNNTDIGNNAFIVANNNIEIGENVILAPYVYISDHIHEYRDIEKSLHNQPLTQGGYVKVGNNVFIGIKASVLPNVTLGDHCIIGANAVVTEDVPAYSVAVGNPARVIKKYDFKRSRWVRV